MVNVHLAIGIGNVCLQCIDGIVGCWTLSDVGGLGKAGTAHVKPRPYSPSTTNRAARLSFTLRVQQTSSVACQRPTNWMIKRQCGRPRQARADHEAIAPASTSRAAPPHTSTTRSRCHSTLDLWSNRKLHIQLPTLDYKYVGCLHISSSNCTRKH